MPVVFVLFSLALAFLFQSSQPLPGTEAVIGVAEVYELLCIFHVYIFTPALYVRTIRSALVRALVVFKPGDPERFVHHIGGAFHIPFLVRIFYPQDKFPAVLFRDQVFVQGSAQIPYMHITSRTWCISCPDNSRHFAGLSFRSGPNGSR